MPKGQIGNSIEQMVKHVRTYSNVSVWDVVRLPEERVNKQREANILAICGELDSLAETVDETDLRFGDIDAHIIRLAKLGTYPLKDDVRLVAQMFFDANRLDAK
jgi:hypothetical protein